MFIKLTNVLSYTLIPTENSDFSRIFIFDSELLPFSLGCVANFT